jgi:hypothetical protein
MEISSQLHTLAALPPGKQPLMLVVQKTGQAQELVWMLQ